MVKRTFETFDEMAAFLASVGIELLRGGPGAFEGSVLLAELDSTKLVWSEHTAPAIARAKVERHSRAFIARFDGQAASIVVNGHVLDDDDLVVYRPGATQHAWTKPAGAGVCLFVAVVRSDELERSSVASTGQRFSSGPGLCTLVRPSREAMKALLIAAERIRTALEDPVVGNRLEPSVAMTKDVLTALVLAVASDSERMQGHDWNGDFAARLVDRAERFLREHVGGPIRLGQLCTAAEATERQLERAFKAVYGVSPTRYLKFCRLHLARRALRNAAPAKAVIADVATRLGFQDFGRFAIAYRALFGETPSATFARSRTS